MMFTSALNTVSTPRNSGVIGIGIILATVITLANSDGRLEILPAYDALQSEEIYESAGDWRKPPMFESEWRAPQKKKEGRIKFGYDSAYEQMHAREDELFSNEQFNINEPKPSSQFRINF